MGEHTLLSASMKPGHRAQGHGEERPGERSWRTRCDEAPAYHVYFRPQPGLTVGFPGGTNGKEPACQCRRLQRCKFDPWMGKIPWRSKWQSTLVFLPGASHGQRSLGGCSPGVGRGSPSQTGRKGLCTHTGRTAAWTLEVVSVQMEPRSPLCLEEGGAPPGLLSWTLWPQAILQCVQGVAMVGAGRC